MAGEGKLNTREQYSAYLKRMNQGRDQTGIAKLNPGRPIDFKEFKEAIENAES